MSVLPTHGAPVSDAVSMIIVAISYLLMAEINDGMARVLYPSTRRLVVQIIYNLINRNVDTYT